MRYCPKCDSEFRDGSTSCTEDGTALLDRPAYDAEVKAQDRQPLQELVTIARFTDRFEADELAGDLAEEGFHVALVTDKGSIVGILTTPGQALYGLCVPADEADKAAALVTEWRAALEGSTAEAEKAAEAEATPGQ